jgi:hypothetical protein
MGVLYSGFCDADVGWSARWIPVYSWEDLNGWLVVLEDEVQDEQEQRDKECEGACALGEFV